jgi:hypothetical protein
MHHFVLLGLDRDPGHRVRDDPEGSAYGTDHGSAAPDDRAIRDRVWHNDSPSLALFAATLGRIV